jgi:hypothetical protein
MLRNSLFTVLLAAFVLVAVSCTVTPGYISRSQS